MIIMKLLPHPDEKYQFIGILDEGMIFKVIGLTVKSQTPHC